MLLDVIVYEENVRYVRIFEVTIVLITELTVYTAADRTSDLSEI